ncbi:MAG: hypothetical protein ACRD1R_17995 [Acidobacteriota bacterium]
MRILKQLLKEFWLPAIIAVLWSLFNLLHDNNHKWSTIKFVNVFGPTFFLISWLTAQYFRVSRQAKVERDLESIETKVATLLGELEAKTNDLLGHLSGGESFCYLMLGSLGRGTNAGQVTVIHQGKHPLYDVTARIVDLQAFERVKSNLTFENLRNTEIHRSYGLLIPGYCKSGEIWNLGDGAIRGFNIFWTARNGGFSQLLRFRSVDDQWYHATKVERGAILLEDIQPGYPRNEKGEVDW